MSNGRHGRLSAEEAAALFAALGDDTRLRLVARLAGGGPASIAELTAEAGVSRQAIRKHLEVLSEAGLVRGRRAGREHVWELRPARLGAARTYLDRVSAQWDEALEALQRLVEE